MRAAAAHLIAGGLGLILSGIGLGQSQSAENITVTTIDIGKDRSELRRLVEAGYDIAGVDYEHGTVDITTATKDETVMLTTFGFNIRSTKTIDPTIAPDTNYKTPAEIEAYVHELALNYPAIVRVESIGKSNENRDIWAVKITDNPEVRELEEPTILFNGMHHAREVMTPEVTIDTIDYLISRYGSDPEVTSWVDNNEIWIVPMLNPDGNNKVWNGNSMWRKNTRGGYGVDLNRNYPYGWNSCNGSSGSTWSDTYRGPNPASEPETQALMGLVARTQPVFNISYHSYSEILIYPYGCKGRRTETTNVVESIGKSVAALIVKDSGRGAYAPGTAWELLYSADGGDIDWMYNAHNVIPYVIELNASSQGFQPAYSWRDKTVERVRPGWQLLFRKLASSGIRGIVKDSSGRAQSQAMVSVATLGKSSMEDINWQVKGDGTYHIVLNPGTYKVSFEHAGKRVERDVVVGNERVDMDIEL